jgi:hypothetical protein
MPENWPEGVGWGIGFELELGIGFELGLCHTCGDLRLNQVRCRRCPVTHLCSTPFGILTDITYGTTLCNTTVSHPDWLLASVHVWYSTYAPSS